MGPLVLIGKDLVLGGSTTKIEDKQVPGVYIYTHNSIYNIYIYKYYIFIFKYIYIFMTT